MTWLYKNLVSQEAKDKFIVDFVVRHWDTHCRTTNPDRARWTLCAQLFRGKMDWGAYRDAYPWRAKVFFHLYSTFVRRMADTVQDLVFQRPDWFALVPMNESDREFARIREKINRHYIEDVLHVPNFSYEYCLSGGIYGLALWKLVGEKCAYYVPEVVLKETSSQEEKDSKRSARGKSISEDPQVQDKKIKEVLSRMFEGEGGVPVSARSSKIESKRQFEHKPKLYCINPLNFAFESDCLDVNESPWTIEKIWKKSYQLESYFETGFFDNKKRSEVQKQASMSLGSGAIRDTYEEQKLEFRDQFEDVDEYSSNVELLDYYGDIRDLDGSVILPCQHIVVANRKTLLRKARNVSWNQKPPYGATIFSRIPNKAVGAGIADNAIDQQLAINEVFNQFLDTINLSTLGVMVCDTSGLDDPSQIEDGIFPGQLLAGSKPAQDIFSRINFDSNIAPQMFQMLNLLQQSGAQGVSVDVNPANPASRARITAQEIGSNTDKASQSLFALAREFDTHFLEPIVKAVDSYCLQHCFTDDGLSELYAKDVLSKDEYELVSGLSDKERINEIRRGVKVQIRGFRDRLERDDQLKRANEAMTVISRDPNAGQFVDLKEVYRWYFRLLLPTEEENTLILKDTPQDKAREENQVMRDGRSVTILPTDPHVEELPVHYAELTKSPQNQALFMHVNSHIQAALQQGLPVPPPPKELEPLFQQFFEQQNRVSGNTAPYVQ